MKDQSYHFSLIKEIKGSSMFLDASSGIAKIYLVNVVDQETVIDLIQSLHIEFERGRCNKIILNEEDLDSYAEGTRDWMKDFLLENRDKFTFRISAVARVTDDVVRANFFTNYIKTAVQVIFPGIRMSNFESEEAAIEWLA
ncbi:MAG: hypothetical protein ABJG78_12150 [Cyclobacteriaceae bacterium]